MDLVLKSGTVVTATDIYRADIGIHNGLVALIGRALQGDCILDIEGKYVFPGAIDPHTHLELRFMDNGCSTCTVPRLSRDTWRYRLPPWSPNNEVMLPVLISVSSAPVMFNVAE